MSHKINIAIDGVAGAGKGTTSKLLAKRLNYKFLDTGAMYRAVGLFMYEKGIKKDNFKPQYLEKIKISFDNQSNVCLNGECVEHKIRNQIIDKYSSDFAVIPEVRKFLSEQQKEIVSKKGYIAEGRDIGSVVMPNAELKIFLTASVDVRAKRRAEMMKERGILVTFDEMVKIIEERDHQDSTREVDPLKKLPDAIEVDTTTLSIDEQVGIIEEIARKIIEK